MNKFMLIYGSNSKVMPKTQEEGMAMIEAWKSWYGDIGENLLDSGFPFVEGAKLTDGEDEQDSDLELHGYLMIQSESYEDAMEVAKKCPLPPGGYIHVFEQQEVPGM